MRPDDPRRKNLRPPFKKGEVQPGAGRPKNPPEFAHLSKLTRTSYALLIQSFLEKPDSELKRLMSDDNQTGLTKMIVGQILFARKNVGSLEAMISRIIGKVPDEVELSQKPRVTIIKRPNGEDVLLDTEISEDKNED